MEFQISNLFNSRIIIEFSLTFALFFFLSLEYVIAFLGSIEASLVVTTVNPWYTSEEISRQLISCRPKAIFCLVDNFDVVKKACLLAQQPDIKVIAINSSSDDSFHNGAIKFNELINLNGKQTRQNINKI